MPVPAIFRRVEWDDDEVPDAHRDLLEAAGAEVLLTSLERMHERDLEVVLVRVIGHPKSAHNTRSVQTRTAAATMA